MTYSSFCTLFGQSAIVFRFIYTYYYDIYYGLQSTIIDGCTQYFFCNFSVDYIKIMQFK